MSNENTPEINADVIMEIDENQQQATVLADPLFQSLLDAKSGHVARVNDSAAIGAFAYSSVPNTPYVPAHAQGTGLALFRAVRSRRPVWWLVAPTRGARHSFVDPAHRAAWSRHRRAPPRHPRRGSFDYVSDQCLVAASISLTGWSSSS